MNKIHIICIVVGIIASKHFIFDNHVGQYTIVYLNGDLLGAWVNLLVW